MAKGGFRGMPGGMNQAAMMKQAQKMQQEPHPVQSSAETVIVKCFPFTPVIGSDLVPSGALASSSSLITTGRITA